MDCEHVLRQIELYLDGELEVALHVEVHEHIESCGPCGGHAEFQRRMKSLLRAKCGCDEVPAHLLERIQAAFTEPPERA